MSTTRRRPEKRRMPAWRGIYGSAAMTPNQRKRIRLFPAERELVGWLRRLPAADAARIKKQVLGAAERVAAP